MRRFFLPPVAAALKSQSETAVLVALALVLPVGVNIACLALIANYDLKLRMTFPLPRL